MGRQITFARTTDWELIRSAVTHPRVWTRVSDDCAPAREEWTPSQDPGIWYIAVHEDSIFVGLFALYPESQVCADLHTCLLPTLERSDAAIIGRELFKWIWKETAFRRITTKIPRFNGWAMVVRAASGAGMKEYGINPASYLKGGELRDTILMGVSKPDASR